MDYIFPRILHIDDVIPFIKDSPEFSIVEKDGYTAISYYVTGGDTFPPPDSMRGIIRRECRGILFDSNGKVLRRPYHKFFNLGEREEVARFDWNRPHVILEKLDGSMITPIVLSDRGIPCVRWSTKRGITDTSMDAEVFIAENKQHRYEDMALDFHKKNQTLIFEWCSPGNRIVVKYDEDRLILTGIRHNETGEYATYDEMVQLGHQYNIPVVRTLKISDLSSIYNHKSMEGIIIRFEDGHMLKVKSEWYTNLHNCKENTRHEKRLIRVILDETLDDILPALDVADAERIEKYRDNFFAGINETSRLIADLVRKCREAGMERKGFALNIVPTLPNHWSAIAFKCWNGGENTYQMVREAVINTVSRNLKNQSGVDSVRHLFNAKWQTTKQRE